VREKIIDIALIVTLIVVAFGITWTLLTLNRSQTPTPSRPPAAERPTPGATEITPLPVNPAVRGGERTSQPAQPQVAPRDEQDESGIPAAREQAASPPNEARVPDPVPVPPGPVRLERVGFSFVTGGAGACGIVLEPWRHVAVSRELLAAYGCGAEVAITLDDEKNGRRQVAAIVADTMNPSFSRTVNIYVAQDEPALQYGITSGVLRP
jgi:hypothetical protein